MLNTAYTKGTWFYELRSPTDNAFTISNGIEIIGTIGCWNSNDTAAIAEAEANAKLIAAAPKLLATLHTFFCIMHDYRSSVLKGYVQQSLKQSSEVITEATGVRP